MSVNQISRELQELFIFECQRLGRSSGFCQRSSPLLATSWVQGLVFGWLEQPRASVAALARAIAVAGSPVSPQAVQQRFGKAEADLLPGACLLRRVLERMTGHALHNVTRTQLSSRQKTWLEAFPAIWIRDSTIIALPDTLHDQWPGSGTTSRAGLKISTQWEWHRGALAPLHITPARIHDQKAAKEQDRHRLEQGHPVQPGEMHVFDLGYFSLSWMTGLHQQGAYFCCRYKTGTHLGMESGEDSQLQWSKSPLDWLESLPSTQTQAQCPVFLGQRAHLPVRLVAVRVPPDAARERREEMVYRGQRKCQPASDLSQALCGWNLYVTNAPEKILSAQGVVVLYRLRWQIERLFRLWKETLQIDSWRTQNPGRILCEVWAKLIGALLTQRLTAFCAWEDPGRSLIKCAQTVSAHAMGILVQLHKNSALCRQLQALQRACLAAAKLERRRTKPATFQRVQSIKEP